MQDQVGRKVMLTKAALEEGIDNIRGAVMIAFPQGLPEWDLVRQAIEGTEELAGTSVSHCCIPHLASSIATGPHLVSKAGTGEHQESLLHMYMQSLQPA